MKIRQFSEFSRLQQYYLSYFRYAFTVVRCSTSSNENSKSLKDSGKINRKVDLLNERVVHTVIVKPGNRLILCRCWKSNKFPYCDGAHKLHNKEFGDNIGPVIITCPSEISPETTGDGDKPPPI
jgi:CDGSH-type Zn-finger protein